MRDFMKILEGFGTYTEVEFVCINPTTGGSDPTKIKALYGVLSKMPGLLLVRQDYMEEAGHLAMTAIITDESMVSKSDITKATRQTGVKIDVINQISDRSIDQMYDGTYENMIDMLATSGGFYRKGVCWSEDHKIT